MLTIKPYLLHNGNKITMNDAKKWRHKSSERKVVTKNWRHSQWRQKSSNTGA